VAIFYKREKNDKRSGVLQKLHVIFSGSLSFDQVMVEIENQGYGRKKIGFV
jgi:hypothetical protein